MKYKELATLTKENLQKRLDEMTIELMKLQTQASSGTAQKESGKIRSLKRTIARIKTLQNKT